MVSFLFPERKDFSSCWSHDPVHQWVQASSNFRPSLLPMARSVMTCKGLIAWSGSPDGYRFVSHALWKAFECNKQLPWLWAVSRMSTFKPAARQKWLASVGRVAAAELLWRPGPGLVERPPDERSWSPEIEGNDWGHAWLVAVDSGWAKEDLLLLKSREADYPTQGDLEYFYTSCLPY